eukprot:61737-Pyramimonas_sp.AAC.1
MLQCTTPSPGHRSDAHSLCFCSISCVSCSPNDQGMVLAEGKNAHVRAMPSLTPFTIESLTSTPT